MKDEQLFHLAVEKWGELSQIDMAIEECGELIVALQHLKRNRGSWLTDVLPEVVDVELTVGQLKHMIDGRDLNLEYCKAKMRKLARLKDLLDVHLVERP